MNLELIKKEAIAKGWVVRDFCREIGITEQGFYKMIAANSMRLDLFERCVQTLHVSPLIFLDGKKYEENKNAETKVSESSEISTKVSKKTKQKLSQLSPESRLYEQLIASKDAEIAALKKLIATLERGTDSGQKRNEKENFNEIK